MSVRGQRRAPSRARALCGTYVVVGSLKSAPHEIPHKSEHKDFITKKLKYVSPEGVIA
jgi:hypothetical protein